MIYTYFSNDARSRFHGFNGRQLVSTAEVYVQWDAHPRNLGMVWWIQGPLVWVKKMKGMWGNAVVIFGKNTEVKWEGVRNHRIQSEINSDWTKAEGLEHFQVIELHARFWVWKHCRNRRALVLASAIALWRLLRLKYFQKILCSLFLWFSLDVAAT